MRSPAHGVPKACPKPDSTTERSCPRRSLLGGLTQPAAAGAPRTPWRRGARLAVVEPQGGGRRGDDTNLLGRWYDVHRLNWP